MSLLSATWATAVAVVNGTIDEGAVMLCTGRLVNDCRSEFDICLGKSEEVVQSLSEGTAF